MLLRFRLSGYYLQKVREAEVLLLAHMGMQPFNIIFTIKSSYTTHTLCVCLCLYSSCTMYIAWTPLATQKKTPKGSLFEISKHDWSYIRPAVRYWHMWTVGGVRTCASSSTSSTDSSQSWLKATSFFLTSFFPLPTDQFLCPCRPAGSGARDNSWLNQEGLCK